MECYDISHTMGENTVASCVSFNREGPDSANYRRFNIEGISLKWKKLFDEVVNEN